MKSVINVLKEQIQSFYLIRRLSVYEIKNNSRNNILGSFWEYFNFLIQLGIYWFVFANVRSRAGITLENGHTAPYFYWITAGFILWMFFQKAAIEGSSSIYSRIRILSKMNFPMSIVPTFVIFSFLYTHLVMVLIGMVIFNIGGIHINIYYLQLLYFIPAAVIFLFALSLITSTLSTMLRDLHMLFSAVLRMVLYISPVLWEVGKVKGTFGILAKLNPLYYLLEGYRSAFFGTEWYFINHWHYTLYFWGITLVLFFIGAALHMKFRRHFVDFL